MTTSQTQLFEELTKQMMCLAAQVSTNSVNIATLAEATNNLKNATERLWSGADQQRAREDQCRSEMRDELDTLRKDFDGAICTIRDSLSNVKYFAGALSVVGGMVGAIIGFLLH
jgi:hypothetical protein